MTFSNHWFICLVFEKPLSWKTWYKALVVVSSRMSMKGLLALTCLFVLLGLEVKGSEIGFRVKDWDPSEEYLNKPLAIVPVGRQLNTHQLAFCFRFQIYGSFGKQIGFSDSNNFLKFGVWFRFQDNYGFVFLNEKALIFNIPKGILRPYSWYYFCFSINDNHYIVVVNGRIWLENIYMFHNLRNAWHYFGTFIAINFTF